MKFIRKPVFTTLTLLVVIGVVYFMSSSSSDTSLGASIPINLAKDYISSKYDPQAESQPQTINEPLDDTKAIKRPLDITKETKEPLGDTPEVPESQQPLLNDEGSFGIQIEDDLTIVHNPDTEADADGVSLSPSDDKSTGEITETPFMPKMANETLKAQLGSASWRLFHTILARYPDKPSQQEKSTLAQYIHLFAQVYPCGDCARHFQKLLEKFPPQIGSRKTAALWGCDIHNKVNDKLKKPMYDCTSILEDYDCGCGDDEKEVDRTLGEGESIAKLRETAAKDKTAAKSAPKKGADVSTAGLSELISDEDGEVERLQYSETESLQHLKDITIDEKEEGSQLGG